jgi:hypothetical protein
MMVAPEPKTRRQTTHVYNSGYKGKTYAVKYLGIVDGAMGILSRKMAMPSVEPEGRARPLVTGEVSGMPTHITSKMKAVEPEWKLNKLQSMKPVLGEKNYSQSIAQHEIGINVSD